ncbi:hypothetical protein VTL71DRAFT_14154 [Oculimacula yallundae]|uniref:Uncharacterized protein n=1 Tax=Oculimacula yallundae TaxID=86028 RepID=A0ABR4CIC7_9HELO
MQAFESKLQSLEQKLQEPDVDVQTLQILNNSQLSNIQQFDISNCQTTPVEVWLSELLHSSPNNANPPSETLQSQLHTTNFVSACLFLSMPIEPAVAATVSHTCVSSPSETITKFYSQIATTVLTIPRHAICTDDLQNQDMLIRTVLFDWSVIDARPHHCLIWALLRLVDISLCKELMQAERFLLLRHVHLMLLFKSGCLDIIPSWYKPRPTQLLFGHEAVIDYLAWPGLRERLVVSPALRMTDQF